MTEDEEQAEVERVRVWVGRLQEFISSLDGMDGAKPIDLCEKAIEAWQSIVASDMPPITSPAILIAYETVGALTQVMTTVTMDWADTLDVRDRLTRDATQQLLKDALDHVLADSQRWLSEEMPSSGLINQRLAAVAAELQTALDANAKNMAEHDAEDADAAANPYGAVLGYHDPNRDGGIMIRKVCSFTEAENKRYLAAYERLRKMLDSELFRHISDESDVLSDVLVGILRDLQDRRLSLFDEDAMDERRRKIRSALISFTSALQIHQEQTVNAAKGTFGRNTSETTEVQDLFNDLKKRSFEYGWLKNCAMRCSTVTSTRSSTNSSLVCTASLK